MSVEERLNNLKETGALKDAARDETMIRQYLTNAKEFRADAVKAQSASAQFVLAYEALHALSMAYLNDQSVRTGGEGHRAIALQLSIVELTQGKTKGAAEAIIGIHNARNNTTYYKPIPPISKRLSEATLKLLEAALAGADATIKLEEVEPSPGPA